MANGLLDLDVPFFLPVWRRVATVAVAAGWGLFEIAAGSAFWGMISIGIGCIAAWRFTIADWGSVAEEDEKG